MDPKDLISDPSPESISPERMAQFVALYTEHCPRIQYYLTALVPTSHDAVDVLQETSLVLWRKFDTFEVGTNFMAWACKIARLQALKHYQKSGRRTKLFQEEVLDQLAIEAQATTNDSMALMDALETCLARLSRNDQILIRKRYEHGTTVNQMAAEIGRTANSLSKSLGRIRRALMICVEKQLPADWTRSCNAS